MKVLFKYVYSVYIRLKFALNMRSLVRRLTLLDSAVYSICTSDHLTDFVTPRNVATDSPVCVCDSVSQEFYETDSAVWKTLLRLTPQCPTHCGARIKYVILCIQVIFKKILSKYVYSVFIWLKFALNMRSIVSRRRLMLLDSCIPYVWVFHVTYRRLSCNFLFRRVS